MDRFYHRSLRIVRSLVLPATTIGMILFLGIVPRANAEEADKAVRRHAEECSLATLDGSYLVTGRADARSDVQDPSFPREHLAVWNFDGQGNMSGFATFSNGGTIGRRTPVEATYTLDSDCTGTFTFVPTTGAGWELFVTTDGSEGRLLNLNPGTIATRSFKRR